MRSLLLDPVVTVPRRGGAALDRHPRLRVRRAQRRAPPARPDRRLHRLLQGRLQRAQRARLRLHVEPGAVRRRCCSWPACSRSPRTSTAPPRWTGPGYWQRFRYVTLPALRPILFLVLVLGTVNGFLMLDLIYVLTMGGPAQRDHHHLLARLPDELRLLQVRAGDRDPLHADRALPAADLHLPPADPGPVRARGLSRGDGWRRDRGYRGGSYKAALGRSRVAALRPGRSW